MLGRVTGLDGEGMRTDCELEEEEAGIDGEEDLDPTSTLASQSECYLL
jgi:hypothetical protein